MPAKWINGYVPDKSTTRPNTNYEALLRMYFTIGRRTSLISNMLNGSHREVSSSFDGDASEERGSHTT